MKGTTATSGTKLNTRNTQGSHAEELGPSVLECKLELPLRKFYGWTIPLRPQNVVSHMCIKSICEPYTMVSKESCQCDQLPVNKVKLWIPTQCWLNLRATTERKAEHSIPLFTEKQKQVVLTGSRVGNSVKGPWWLSLSSNLLEVTSDFADNELWTWALCARVCHTRALCAHICHTCASCAHICYTWALCAHVCYIWALCACVCVTLCVFMYVSHLYLCVHVCITLGLCVLIYMSHLGFVCSCMSHLGLVCSCIYTLPKNLTQSLIYIKWSQF